MPLSGNQKLLILVVVVVVILYLVYMQKEGAETVSPTVTPTVAQVAGSVGTVAVQQPAQETTVKPIIVQDETLKQSETDKLLLDKMTTKNTAKEGEYKQISYADGKRDATSKNLDDFFEQGNPLSDNENAAFLPMILVLDLLHILANHARNYQMMKIQCISSSSKRRKTRLV
jgi:hypothetical protein